MTPRPKCPRCSSNDVVPIEYGLPDRELIELAERGEAAIGGCVIMEGAPQQACRHCGNWF